MKKLLLLLFLLPIFIGCDKHEDFRHDWVCEEVGTYNGQQSFNRFFIVEDKLESEIKMEYEKTEVVWYDNVKLYFTVTTTCRIKEY